MNTFFETHTMKLYIFEKDYVLLVSVTICM